MPAKLKPLPVYEDQGEIAIEHADDSNVPVDIHLGPAEDDAGEEIPDLWELRASNYMPRKGVVVEGNYCAQSADREVLAALVRQHWLPLYLAAVQALATLTPDEDRTAGLYKWKAARP